MPNIQEQAIRAAKIAAAGKEGYGGKVTTDPKGLESNTISRI